MKSPPDGGRYERHRGGNSPNPVLLGFYMGKRALPRPASGRAWGGECVHMHPRPHSASGTLMALPAAAAPRPVRGIGPPCWARPVGFEILLPCREEQSGSDSPRWNNCVGSLVRKPETPAITADAQTPDGEAAPIQMCRICLARCNS